MRIPKTHPRYKSLTLREELIKKYREGVVVTQGLLAHGRGEAFDYLLGEKTIKEAELAERCAGALLLLAKKPVLSVNGNTAALAGKDLVKLSRLTQARIEVNLFHRSQQRVSKIAELLRKLGAKSVLGEKATAKIPGLNSSRALCTEDGIFSADTILVALEDGDRTEALVKFGKKVIAIDLNPLSRTAQAASVTIVDDVARAIKGIISQAKKLKCSSRAKLEKIATSFDNSKNLKEVLRYLSERLKVVKWY